MNRLIHTFHIVLAFTTIAADSREKHECSRLCVSTAPEHSRICNYKFIVAGRAIGSETEKITLASERVINGSSPGPPIEICLGDKIVVIVENKLSSEEVSFHWHGLRHRGSPHMDGVSMISQCPIFPYTSFRYEMKPETTGTYFYHAHEVRQQGDGLYGSLTVRGPGDDPRYEKILLVSARPSGPLSRLIRLREPFEPRDLLLNGRDRDANINVENDRKYLLRLVNANAFECPISFYVDRHTLEVVACDGRSVIRRTSAKRVILFPGERFDVTIETNKKPGKYSIILQGLGVCRGLTNEAFLIYDDHDDPAIREERLIGDQFEGKTPTRNCHEGIFSGDAKTLCSLDLIATEVTNTETNRNHVDEEEEEEEEESNQRQIQTYYIPFDIETYKDINDRMTDYTFNIYGSSYYPSFLSTRTNAARIAQINRVTFEYPPSPISSQPRLVADDTICSIDTRSKSCNSDQRFFCQCTQILKVPLSTTVDIVLIDQGFGGNASHTFHVHGYHVGIIGAGEFERPVTREEIIRLKNEGKLNPKTVSLEDQLKKDTFVVPNKGYLVLRLRTDNIGYWLWEARSTGIDGNGPSMQFVMLVGSRENIPPVPLDFPTCGNHKGPASIFEDD